VSVWSKAAIDRQLDVRCWVPRALPCMLGSADRVGRSTSSATNDTFGVHGDHTHS
jgi:hypothetical protein